MARRYGKKCKVEEDSSSEESESSSEEKSVSKAFQKKLHIHGEGGRKCAREKMDEKPVKPKLHKGKYIRPDERVSDKTETFVNSDMKVPRGKPVTAVPGIGPAIGRSLADDGIKLASDLYGEFLSRSKEDFMQFISDHGGNKRHQNDAYHGLKDWDTQHGGI